MQSGAPFEQQYIYATNEMAHRIRAFPWETTPLGSFRQWPASLLGHVNRMLDSGFPTLLWWGEDEWLFYNDAYRQLRERNAAFRETGEMGNPGHSAAPQLWQLLQQKKQRVVTTGSPLYLENERLAFFSDAGLQQICWTGSFDPLRNEHGEITGLMATFKETGSVFRQLQTKEQEQAFLFRLSDRLHVLEAPWQVETEAIRMLGIYLGVDRLGFAEIQTPTGELLIRHCFCKPGFPPLEGVYHLHRYGSGLADALRSGETIVKPDIASDPDLSAAEREAHLVLQASAIIDVPLLKAGRLVAILFAHQRNAYAWTANEISLLSQSAARIWDAVLVARKEQELADIAAEYRSIFESLDEAFMVIDFIFDTVGQPVNYTFVRVNPAFELQSGLKDVVGKTILNIMPGIETSWIEQYGRVAVSGNPLRFEEYNGGTGRWYDVYAAAMQQSPGKVVVVFKDITERKIAEQRKNDFLSIASHELKTPLTSLKGYIHILQQLCPPGKNRQAFDVASRAAGQTVRMTGIINSFLSIAQLDAGKLLLQPQQFDLSLLIQEVCGDIQSRLQSHPVELAGIPPVVVQADRNKICQVIENLVGNAMKYSPAGSPIRLSCIPGAKEVTVQVTDQGIGVNAADIPKVFDRFYRSVSNDIATISGFGIGLYICREIVERHGGRIGVTSELHKGSTFWFTLPLTD
jgi:PAS domain S-box-containing protein